MKRFTVTKPPFEQCSRGDRINKLQGCGIEIAIEACKLFYCGRNSPSFFLPMRFSPYSNHIHNSAMAQRIVEQNSIATNEHSKGTLFDIVGHTVHG